MGMFSDIEYWKDLAVERADEIAKLRAELAEAKKDAERYRWLREECNIEYEPEAKVQLVIEEPIMCESWRQYVDDLIDAAMRTTEESSADGETK
jgi:hypothetical protein